MVYKIQFLRVLNEGQTAGCVDDPDEYVFLYDFFKFCIACQTCGGRMYGKDDANLRASLALPLLSAAERRRDCKAMAQAQGLLQELAVAEYQSPVGKDVPQGTWNPVCDLAETSGSCDSK